MPVEWICPLVQSSFSEMQVGIHRAAQVVSSEPQLQSYCSKFAESCLEKEINHGRLIHMLGTASSLFLVMRNW